MVHLLEELGLVYKFQASTLKKKISRHSEALTILSLGRRGQTDPWGSLAVF